MQEKTDHEMTAIMEQLESLLQKNQPLNEIDGVVCCADFKVNVNNILHRYILLHSHVPLYTRMQCTSYFPSLHMYVCYILENIN